MIKIFISLFFIEISCKSFDSFVSEEKALQDILHPALVEKIWRPNSCLTYRSRIGTCLTSHQCLSRNGTIGGLCLSMFHFCCIADKVNDKTKPSKDNVIEEVNPNQGFISVNLPLNSKCVTNSKKPGICLESEECIKRMGNSDGICGHSIICCHIESSCGKSVQQNGTEIVNDFYPLTTSDANVCQVIIERVPDVCQIKLDLLEFDLAQPDPDGRCTTDALIIKSPVGEQMPIICGQNSGQHFYLEMARNHKKFGNPIRISIVTNGQNYHRKWRIRIVMIDCKSIEMAPNGCLQYLTSVSGIVRSFNFGDQIPNRARYMSDLHYTVCIRPEENYCFIEWWPEFEGSFSWGQQMSNHSLLVKRTTDLCTDDDFITIDDSLRDDKTPEEERICGQSFAKNNYLFSQSKPFNLKVYSNANQTPNNLYSQIGFSLIYKQIECNHSSD